MKTVILLLTILFLLAGCSRSEIEKLGLTYLKENYEVDWDKVESISIEEQPIYYNKKRTPKLEKIEVKLLEQKAGYSFIKVVLSTVFMEYPHLEVILAIPDEKGNSIREIRSPGFSDVSLNFLDIFQSLQINSKMERNKLVDQISYLFKEITFNGSIKNIVTEKNDVKSELWQGNQALGWIEFYFDETYLVNVKFEKPN